MGGCASVSSFVWKPIGTLQYLVKDFMNTLPFIADFDGDLRYLICSVAFYADDHSIRFCCASRWWHSIYHPPQDLWLTNSCSWIVQNSNFVDFPFSDGWWNEFMNWSNQRVFSPTKGHTTFLFHFKLLYSLCIMFEVINTICSPTFNGLCCAPTQRPCSWPAAVHWNGMKGLNQQLHLPTHIGRVVGCN